MSSTRIDLKDAGSFLADKLGPKQRQAAMRGLKSAALRGLQLIQAEIIPSRTPQPVDRGVYRAGWKVTPIKGGFVLHNDEPHAALIEHGVRAANVKIGRAMIGALQEWARRHGFEDPLGAAWALAKAIKRRGLWGQTGLNVLDEATTRLREGIVREEVERELERKGL